ncbi:MAG TPA: hypothetical protein VHQ47_13430 [Phycisphaerae bacterium]|nr:hypothetical protein [Phycisphaerae bacterium]
MPYSRHRPHRHPWRGACAQGLEPLEPRELLSTVVAASAPTFYPDIHQAPVAQGVFQPLKTPQIIATVNGVDPTLAPHAMIRWDNGATSVGIFQATGFGKLALLAANPPASAGQHRLTAAFWQSAPGGRVVNASQGVAVANVSEATPNGGTLSGYVGQALTGSVGGVATTIPDVFDSKQTPFSYTANGYTLTITATIQWGDGASSTGELVKNISGLWDVIGTHVYGAAGTFTVHYGLTQTVTGPDGGGHTQTVTSTLATEVSQANIRPVAAAPGPELWAIQGASFTKVLGAIGLGFNISQAAASSDLANGVIRYIAPGHATGSEYHVVIAWGDGQFSSASLSPNDPTHWMVSGTHTYTGLHGYTAFVAAQYVGVYVPGQATQPAAHAYPPQAQFSTVISLAQKPYQAGGSFNSVGLPGGASVSNLYDGANGSSLIDKISGTGSITFTGPTGSGGSLTGAGTLTLTGAGGSGGTTITGTTITGTTIPPTLSLGSGPTIDPSQWITSSNSPILNLSNLPTTTTSAPAASTTLDSALVIIVGPISSAQITVDADGNHTLTLTFTPPASSSPLMRGPLSFGESIYQALVKGADQITGITVQDGQLYWNDVPIPVVNNP